MQRLVGDDGKGGDAAQRRGYSVLTSWFPDSSVFAPTRPPLHQEAAVSDRRLQFSSWFPGFLIHLTWEVRCGETPQPARETHALPKFVFIRVHSWLECVKRNYMEIHWWMRLRRDTIRVEESASWQGPIVIASIAGEVRVRPMSPGEPCPAKIWS